VFGEDDTFKIDDKPFTAMDLRMLGTFRVSFISLAFEGMNEFQDVLDDVDWYLELDDGEVIELSKEVSDGTTGFTADIDSEYTGHLYLVSDEYKVKFTLE
jgi:hypothetical protein